MNPVKLTIQMQLEQADLPSFDGADLMVIPHVAAEREHVLFAMARVEKVVEASKDAEAIRAFQWLGGLLARAKFTQGTRLAQHPAGRRFDA